MDAIATKVDLPDPPDQSLADAFDLSIRSEFIEFLDDKDSAEYTVERVWNARLIVAESRIGQGYVIDDGGLAQVRASVALADASGAEWATAKIDGWLNFEPHTFAANESDSSLSDFELKFQ
ncbi:hypothetical protein ASF51_11745 [Agreia sp. Leaf283]|nr:hypothetical protein ASF51_11745 [Agreia sp. Leaf283]